MNKNIQREFAKHLIVNKNLIACDEVFHYCHRCDVLGVDIRKKLIYEYEFKTSSHDLKISENKKEKYKPCKEPFRRKYDELGFWRYYVYRDWKKPHFFYFVMPKDLFVKEEKYLRNLDVGVITYSKSMNKYHYHIGDLLFYVEKRTKKILKNTQNFDTAFKNVSKRFANILCYG